MRSPCVTPDTAFTSHRNGTVFKVLEEHRSEGNDVLAEM